MLSIPATVTGLRRRCGTVKEFARDRLFSLTRSVVFETRCDDPAGAAFSPAVTFRSAGPADLTPLGEAPHEYGFAEKRFGFERLERGDSFLVGECEGEVVFYAWLMHGQMDLDQNVLIPIAENIAYSYRVFTVDHARGRRICPAYYTWIRQVLRQQGYERLLCRIAVGNTASIHAHQRVGFRPSGHLWKLVLGPRCVYRADARMRGWLRDLCPADYFGGSGLLLRHDL